MRSGLLRFVFVLALFGGTLSSRDVEAKDTKTLDLSNAVVVNLSKGSVAAKAPEILIDEVAKRTGIRIPLVANLPDDKRPRIVIQTLSETANIQMPDGLERPARADAYAIWVESSPAATTVTLLGYDERATLYAAGRLLRLLSMTQGKLEMPSEVRLSTAPDVLIRGHQLGYRDSANSYDAWDVKQYEQYLRDLIVFGTNAIELIPAMKPDVPQNPLMPLSPWDMNRKLCDLCAAYGLEVWMWVPVEGNVEDPQQAAEELARWRKLFQSCSRIDHIFVPGGDPGDTPPEILLPWLKQMTDMLHESHPKAGVWVSNQGFTPDKNEIFFGYLREHEPDWLNGVVFGPWVKHTLAEARARTPRKYRIRLYPDICHTLRCEYSVPDWDPAFCQALGREPYNPRPRAMAHIHNSLASLFDGFGTYSDGINDDVNKIVWSACGWDKKQGVDEILADYGRYFIHSELGPDVAQGLLALEDNWRGPLATNDRIEATLAHWQQIERRHPEIAKTNWRLQLPLLRANYDAYLKQRLIRHNEIEDMAIESLSKASDVGVAAAIASARKSLALHETDQTAHDLHIRLMELGRQLSQSIGMQLDTPNFGANRPDRGAVLDYLDFPLNDSPWLESQFVEILALKDTQEQQRRVQQIVNWENPGEGGFYDDLGCVGKQPHLLPTDREGAWKDDPSFVGNSQSEFGDRENYDPLRLSSRKLSWCNQAETLYGTPLRMRYQDLDPAASYRLRVTYAGRFHAKMRLRADQTYEIHGPLSQPTELWPQEFDVPVKATADGVLELQWELIEQRGCQVAEVWLLKQSAAAPGK